MYRKYVASISSLIITLLLYYCVLNEQTLSFIRDRIDSCNIFIYLLGIFVFTVSYFIFYFNSKINQKIVDNAVSLVLVCFIVVMLNICFENLRVSSELDTGYFHYNKYIVTIAVCVTSFLVAFLNRFDSNAKCKTLTLLSYMAIIFALVVTIRGLNFHAERLTDYALVHNEATFSEIYNLYHGEPFSRLQFGIYGRYAFFYVIIFKIIGLSVRKYIFIQTAVACLIVLSFAYFIMRTVNNKAIRLLLLICLSLLWGRMYTITYQAVIRLFPIAIMFLWMGYTGQKVIKSKTVVLGFVLGALGLIWNIEYGAVATLSWMTYVVFIKCSTCGNDWKVKTINIAKGIAYSILTFIGAWLFAGVINCFICGGEFLSLQTFTIPYLNRNYMVNSLQTWFLSRNDYPWLWVVSIVLLSVGIFCFPVIIEGKVNENDGTNKIQQNGLIVFACVSILGGITYYINRCVFGNLYIIYFPGIALLGLFADRVSAAYFEYHSREISEKSEDNRGSLALKILVKQSLRGLYGGVLVLVCGIVVCTLFDVFYTQSTKFVYDANNEGEILLQSFAQKVPADTPAVGLGMTVIYQRLGWDTGYHLTDAMYQTQEATERYDEILRDGKDKVICYIQIESYVNAGLIDEDIYEIIEEKYNMVHIGNIVNCDYYYLIAKEL